MISHARIVLVTLVIVVSGVVTAPARAAIDPERLSLLVSASRIGLTSDAMASLAMTGGQAGVLLSRLQANESGFAEIQETEAMIAAQRTIIRDSEAALRLNPDDQQAELHRFAAENSRALLLTTLSAQRAEMLGILTTGLADPQDAAVICRSEPEFISLDAPLRHGVSTPEQARDARWALRMEARALADGASTPAEASGVLATLRSQQAVASAIVSRDANLAAIELAVDTWLNGE